MEHRRELTAQTLRPGVRDIELQQWQRLTPEERIEAVWELTQQCMAWQGDGPVEPRLQRSVVHIQRAPR